MASGVKEEAAVLAATADLMEKRLGEVARRAPAFASTLRGYRKALAAGEAEIAEGLLAWLAGQPNVAARVKREAGIKGEVDHSGALTFLQGLLMVLRDSGNPGLVLVLDEVETLQRVRSDIREKSLNALRQFIDELDSGRFPGLFLVVTGTPTFFDGPQGIRKLAPLAQRLATEFDDTGRFDNPRAPQIRLMPFQQDALMEVGRKVRDIFASGSEATRRVMLMVDDKLLESLALGVAGRLGGKVGLAPRIFLKKLVTDVLDRVELHPDFDPRQHYQPVIDGSELNEAERAAAGDLTPDDIELSL